MILGLYFLQLIITIIFIGLLSYLDGGAPYVNWYHFIPVYGIIKFIWDYLTIT